MSELPVKSNDSIFRKIKRAIMNFIFVDYEEEEIKEHEEINVQKEVVAHEEFDAYKEDTIQIKAVDTQAQKDTFNEKIKSEVSNETLKEVEREKFLEKIEANPKLLEQLPLEKLKVLESYYDELIEREEKKNLELMAKANS